MTCLGQALWTFKRIPVLNEHFIRILTGEIAFKLKILKIEDSFTNPAKLFHSY